ncbi:UNVERIFIED_CONTAM: hypothetical protein GTU68_017467 [Idotea baltica]|nr:hypothetical protein [Idotea baltica]
MFAIVEIAGQQFKVESGQELLVNRLEGNAGDKVNIDNVLLVDNGGSVQLGSPSVGAAKVSGSIVEHLKGDKVIVFKKKRRKGYRVKNGFRHSYTKIKIDSIA